MANLRTVHEYTANTRYRPAQSVTTATVWDHQSQMAAFALSMDASIMYAGMTTGKTLFALVTLEHFSGLRLVLSPHRPMVVWTEDYARFYGKGKPYELHILSKGTQSQRLKALRDLAQREANAVVVLNYEIAARLPLEEFNWTAAVADEAHRMGVYNAKQSRALAYSCRNIPFKVAMTGTPLHDGYERIYGVDRWLDPLIPKLYPRAYPQSRRFGSYDDFLDTYTLTHTIGHRRIIVRYKNIPKLADVLRPYVLIVPTEDVVSLPQEVSRRYHVPLSAATRAAYDLLRDESVIAFEQGTDAAVQFDPNNDNLTPDKVVASHLLTRLLRLQQLTTSGELTSDTGEIKLFDVSARYDMLTDILETIREEAGKFSAPVVIFTRFNRDVELITELVMKVYGERTMQLTGSRDQHTAWQAGEERILLVNLAAGSEGVRLTRAADVIFWNLGYSLKQYDQAKRRCARYGQQSKVVRFYYVLSTDTVDEVILNELARKSAEVAEIGLELQALTPSAAVDPVDITALPSIESTGMMLRQTTTREKVRL